VGHRGLTVSFPQNETRRLAAKNVSFDYTIEVSAESPEAANSLAMDLNDKISSASPESLTTAITAAFEELGLNYSFTVLSWVPSAEIEAFTTHSDDGSGSNDSSGDSDPSGDGSGDSDPSGDGSGDGSGATGSSDRGDENDDEEEDGSVMQSQWCIFTMLLLFAIKMD